MTKCINGRFFFCERPGTWRSDDREICILKLNTARTWWQVWVRDALMSEGSTMREAVARWAK